MDKIKENAFVKKVGFNSLVLFCILILLYILFAVLVPIVNSDANANFVSWAHILSAMNYACFMGFLSLGVTFVIATGGIDFSIGPVMFCAALIAGYQLTMKEWPLQDHPACCI